jgi:hypothetical protein
MNQNDMRSFMNQYLKKFLPTAPMRLVAGLTLLLTSLAQYLPEQIHSVWPELKAPGMLLSKLCVATTILFLGTFIILIMLLSENKKLQKGISKITYDKQNPDTEILRNRKAKILSWREQLNKYNHISDLYNLPIYQELYTLIPANEREKLFANSAVVCNIVGDVVLADDMNNRVIKRFYKAISDLEKEWGLI